MRELKLAHNLLTELPGTSFAAVAAAAAAVVIMFYICLSCRLFVLSSVSVSLSLSMYVCVRVCLCVTEEITRLRWLSLLSLDGNPLQSLPTSFAQLHEVVQVSIDQRWSSIVCLSCFVSSLFFALVCVRVCVGLCVCCYLFLIISHKCTAARRDA